MKCKVCGANNEKGTKNCIVCGSELPTFGKVCPQCGAEVEENVQFCQKCGYHFLEATKTTKTCPTCGSTIDINSKFCPQCGATITNKNYKKPTNNSYERASKVSFILGLIALGCTTIFITFFIVGIILGIAAIILGIIGLSKNENKTKSILGLVFGSFGALIGVATLIFVIALLNNTSYYLNIYEDYLEQLNELIKIFIFLI